MKVFGNIDFQLNPVKAFVVEPYDGSADPNKPFPAVQKEGMLVYRTDLAQIFICTSTNPIVWQPLIKLSSTYVYNQSTASGTWTVTHNLGSTNVLVQVFDNNGNKVIPDDILIQDNDTVKITLDPPIAGKAFIISTDSQIGNFVQQSKLSLDVLKSGQNINNIVYDSQDRVTEVDYGDGTKAQITYVPDGQQGAGKTQTITFLNSANTVIEKWQYTYDQNNRLIKLQRVQ